MIVYILMGWGRPERCTSFASAESVVVLSVGASSVLLCSILSTSEEGFGCSINVVEVTLNDSGNEMVLMKAVYSTENHLVVLFVRCNMPFLYETPEYRASMIP